MSTRIPSLGEEKLNHHLLKETYPLPASRKGILSLLEQLLVQGGVQAVEIRIGHPLKIERMVSGMPEPTEDTSSNDLLDAIRNIEMEELVGPEDLNAFEALFRAFQMVRIKHGVARVLLVQSHGLLRRWLKIDQLSDVSEVYGVPTRGVGELSDDSVLLVAARADNPDVLLYTVRVPLNLPKKVVKVVTKKK